MRFWNDRQFADQLNALDTVRMTNETAKCQETAPDVFQRREQDTNWLADPEYVYCGKLKSILDGYEYRYHCTLYLSHLNIPLMKAMSTMRVT